MSKAKDAGDLFTDLEETLRTVDAVAKVLLRIGTHREEEAITFHFLGSQLRENRELAHHAFSGLHDLVHSNRQAAASGSEGEPGMSDWYFAGMFDETFWAQVEKQRFTGRGAAEVRRQLIAEARDGDLTWLSRASMLDTLCRAEPGFEIKRRGERVQWVLNPFRDRPGRHGR
jgi:hypothetical protein